MNNEETLVELYRIRIEIESRARRRFAMGIGDAYTDDLRKIDEQIKEIEKKIGPQSGFQHTVGEKSDLEIEIIINVNGHQLIIGENKISWDSSSIEWSLLHTLLEKAREVSWDEIIEHYEPYLEKKSEDKNEQKKQIGDARNRINKKVIKESNFKNQLVERKNNQYKFSRKVIKSD